MTSFKSPFSFKYSVLALGTETNTTFSLLKKNTVYLSRPYNDLKDPSVFESFKKDILKEEKSLRIKPDIIACDTHPEYISTGYAKNISEREKNICLIAIQHHHAHIASCMAENGLTCKVIGVAFDGAGYGSDGKIWGGEFLVSDYNGFERAAHLEYVPMPGADKAALEPIRMAFSYIYKAYKGDVKRTKTDILRRLGRGKAGIFAEMIDRNVNSPLTSSAGRLFDAVSSLAGVKDFISYEGEAAIALEKIAAPDCGKGYGFQLETKNGMINIKLDVMIKEILADLRKEKASVISRKFHNTLAEAIIKVCGLLRKKKALNSVVLSGGVFQNKILFEEVKKKLLDTRFKVYSHSKVSPSDKGISLGQAVIAAFNCEFKHRLKDAR